MLNKQQTIEVLSLMSEYRALKRDGTISPEYKKILDDRYDALKHNHPTREIKDEHECPACDRIHLNMKQLRPSNNQQI